MSESARQDVISIWKAAVSAVDSEALVQNNLRVDGNTLHIADQQISLIEPRHIEIVGAGKAGAGMGRAAEDVLSALPSHITWGGWINVPEDCVDELSAIRLFGARPAGINEPTEVGVKGTREILRRVSRLRPQDICVVMLSGGGSALLPAPTSGISLDDKLAVTRLLAASGASIQELNIVRSRLSAIKAGGLARACTAGTLVTLIISDVIGDPLDIIASGPTFAPSIDEAHRVTDPMRILRKYAPDLTLVPPDVVRLASTPLLTPSAPDCAIRHKIIGNNQTAIHAAANEAAARGFRVINLGSENDGPADKWGVTFFRQMQSLRRENADQSVCVLAGGETTVTLCDASVRGRGGRNQEIVLSAIADSPSAELWADITLLSGGTDGEDGPTPAAGAIADTDTLTLMQKHKLEPKEFLAQNNAWPFFDQLNSLLTTGPTHTNVMDVQVGIVKSQP